MRTTKRIGLAMMLLVTGCGPDLGPEVLQVGSLTLHAKEAKALVEIRGTLHQPERWLSSLGEQQVMAEEALSRKLAETWELNAVAEDAKRRFLAKRLQMATLGVERTDAELKKYYEDHKSSFEKTYYDLSRLLVRSEITAHHTKEDAEQWAMHAWRFLEGGRSFAEAVEQFSDEKAAVSKKGALGEISAARLGKTTLEALQKLQEGQHSTVIQTNFGFEIYKLNKPSRRVTSSFEDSKSKITMALQNDALVELKSALAQKEKIQMYPERLTEKEVRDEN